MRDPMPRPDTNKDGLDWLVQSASDLRVSETKLALHEYSQRWFSFAQRVASSTVGTVLGVVLCHFMGVM